jgi:hypothetical protein
VRRTLAFTLVIMRQHARMLLLILSVGVTEPSPTRPAVYGRRKRASFIVRRDALTQPFPVLAPAFCFFQQHDKPRAAIVSRADKWRSLTDKYELSSFCSVLAGDRAYANPKSDCTVDF